MAESTIKLFEFVLSFSYTIILITIIAGFLYYKRNGQKAFFFTYVLAAAVVFQLCIILVRIPMELGFAIGLFAIFGIIRYRTSPINPREMTYLLVSAGIAAKNALTIDSMEHYKMLVSDAMLVLIIILLEFLLFKKSSKVKIIVYNKLELIHEDFRPQLISDLETSFGIKNIEKIQVGKIDTVRNSAQLKVYFLDKGDQNFSPDTLV